MISAIVCDFSTSLSDIPSKMRSNDDYVLNVLRNNNGRFSCFEASEHQSLAKTLDRLKKQGRITYTNPQPAYPWNKVEVKE